MGVFLQALSSAFAAVSEQVWASLVQVRYGDRGMGAGTIVRADGLIVTNAHVVGGQRGRHGHNRAPAITVCLMDGREAPAKVVAVDAEHDLAALTVDLPDLTPLALGDHEELRAGSLVLALGFPWGVAGGATSGIVIDSVPTALTPATSGGDAASVPWLAASLHLRPGHSGGPMVNSRGQLVGINTMMSGPDVGVAIPVQLVARFVNSISSPHNMGDVIFV